MTIDWEFNAVVRKRGQITIPKQMREDLDINEGDIVFFYIQDIASVGRKNP